MNYCSDIAVGHINTLRIHLFYMYVINIIIATDFVKLQTHGIDRKGANLARERKTLNSHEPNKQGVIG